MIVSMQKKKNDGSHKSTANPLFLHGKTFDGTQQSVRAPTGPLSTTQVFLSCGTNFFRLEVGFKPSSRYNSGAPVCRWFSYSHCHATSFDLRICGFALLRDCTMQDQGLNSLTCIPSRLRVRYFVSLYALVPRNPTFSLLLPLLAHET